MQAQNVKSNLFLSKSIIIDKTEHSFLNYLFVFLTLEGSYLYFLDFVNKSFVTMTTGGKICQEFT